MTIERHYTTGELADLLNCSPDTVLRLAQKGDIRSCFVGRERRYPESGVEQYLQRSMNAAPAVASLVQLRKTPTSQTRRTA